MTTMISLILALMLSIGGTPAGGPGNTGIQAPIDNSCTINRNFEDYTQKTASRPIPKKTLKIVFIGQPKTKIMPIFTLPLKGKLHLVGYEDSMNLYQAFNMNPINFTDPFGQFIDSPTPGTRYKNDPNAGFWGLTWEGSSKGMYEHGGEALAFGTLLTADAIAVPFDKALDVIDWAAQKTGVAQFFGFDPGETKEVVGLTAILLAGQPETAMVSTAARARLSGFGGKYFGRVKNFLQNIIPGTKAIDKADELTDVTNIKSNSIQRNRATGTYEELRAAGEKDAHHIIQDASVKELPGYNKNKAPAVKLEGPSNRYGTEHYIATKIQKGPGGGTYAAERHIAYKALRRAGFSEAEARNLIKIADDFFSKLGVKPQTTTRIPKNRRGY